MTPTAAILDPHEHSPIGVAVVNGGAVIAANPAWSRLVGAADARGTLAGVVVPGDAPSLESAVAEIASGSADSRTGVVRLAAGGREIGVALSALPGEVPRAVLVTLLTPAPEAADGSSPALAVHAEASLRAFLDHSPAVMHVKDREHRYLVVNRRFLDGWGVSEAEAVGRPAESFQPPEAAARLREHERRVLAEGTVEEFEEVHEVDGELHRWWTVKFPIRDEVGKVVGIGGVSTDIQARVRAEEALRESEERHRTVVETLHEGVVLQGPDGIRAWNGSAERILGLSGDELAGRTSVDPRWAAVHPDGTPWPGDTHPAMVTIRTGEPQAGVLMGLQKPGGERTWVRINTSPVRREAEGWLVAVSFTDVTEALEAQRDLERSNQELASFVSVASHDLSEPLRIITGFATLLESRYGETLDPTAREFLGHITAGVGRMQALIDALVAYSRVDRGELEAVPVDTGRLLEEVVATLRPSIEEAGARIDVGELPTVPGDPVQLGQVFQNLLSNAVKFRREGRPPTVTVAAARDGAAWRFTVSDDGIGIEPERTREIFEMFRRLHTRAEYPGSGIGLAICQRIVERHGGRIWADGTPGEGARFHFTIPAAAGEETPT